MGTRSVIGFHGGKASEAPDALIYRHSDGYPDGPDGVPADFVRFLAATLEQTTDTRFSDATMLAARFVVWQAGEFARDKATPLDFLSVRIVRDVPGDVAYLYAGECGKVPRLGYRPANESTWLSTEGMAAK